MERSSKSSSPVGQHFSIISSLPPPPEFFSFLRGLQCIEHTFRIRLNFFLVTSYKSLVTSYYNPGKTSCNNKNSTCIFPLPTLPPFQCCRLAVVGVLAGNSTPRCLSHSLINIKWGDMEDCRGVTLVLSTIVWKLKNPTKVYFWKVFTENLFWRLC